MEHPIKTWRKIMVWTHKIDYPIWLLWAFLFSGNIINSIIQIILYEPPPFPGFGDSLFDLYRSVIVNLIITGIFIWLSYRQYYVARAIRRIKQGKCTCCDYDLSGSDHSNLCPECGKSIRRKLPGWYIKQLEKGKNPPAPSAPPQMMPKWWSKSIKRKS